MPTNFPLKRRNRLQSVQTPQQARPVPGSVGGATGQQGGPRFINTDTGQGAVAKFDVTLVNFEDQLESVRQTLKQNDGTISTVIASFAPGTYDLSSWSHLPIAQDVTLILEPTNGNPSSVILNFFGVVGPSVFLFNIRNAVFQLVLNVVLNFNIPAAAGLRGGVIRQARPGQGGGAIQIKEGAELHVIAGAGAFGAPFMVNSDAMGTVEMPFSLNECCTGCPGTLFFEGTGSFSSGLKDSAQAAPAISDVTLCILNGAIEVPGVAPVAVDLQCQFVEDLTVAATGSAVNCEATRRIALLQTSGANPTSVASPLIDQLISTVSAAGPVSNTINANIVNNVQLQSTGGGPLATTWDSYAGSPLMEVKNLASGASVNHMFTPNVKGGDFSVNGDSTFTLSSTITGYMNNGVITGLGGAAIQAFGTIFTGTGAGANVIAGTANIGATLSADDSTFLS